jgi:hypothetical protein
MPPGHTRPGVPHGGPDLIALGGPIAVNAAARADRLLRPKGTSSEPSQSIVKQSRAIRAELGDGRRPGGAGRPGGVGRPRADCTPSGDCRFRGELCGRGRLSRGDMGKVGLASVTPEWVTVAWERAPVTPECLTAAHGNEHRWACGRAFLGVMVPAVHLDHKSHRPSLAAQAALRPDHSVAQAAKAAHGALDEATSRRGCLALVLFSDVHGLWSAVYLLAVASVKRECDAPADNAGGAVRALGRSPEVR